MAVESELLVQGVRDVSSAAIQKEASDELDPRKDIFCLPARHGLTARNGAENAEISGEEHNALSRLNVVFPILAVERAVDGRDEPHREHGHNPMPRSEAANGQEAQRNRNVSQVSPELLGFRTRLTKRIFRGPKTADALTSGLWL